MSNQLRIVQLNVKKRGEIQDSLMNDEAMADAAAIAIQEPHARIIQGRLLTTPMAHHRWTKLVPSICNTEGRWACRSMLWVRKDLEVEQVAVESSDLTAALITLPERRLLVVSVYVEGVNTQALTDACNLLRTTVAEARRGAGQIVDVVLAGDFNRHDQLWGGEDVSLVRQGEADEIIDLMSDYSLSSLLPRGTKTWQGPRYESTIDLVLASEALADSVVRCRTCTTEHGSDHRTIETVFEAAVPEARYEEKLLLKNAPWKEIRARIASNLTGATGGTVQERTDALMSVVSEAVSTLTPKARPSPYSKRWWTSDLTQLRRVYTYWRNRARAVRRAGCTDQDLSETAKAAAKQYHDAIRQRKKSHWENFLADNDNIWKAAKYLKPNNESAFGKVPRLLRADGTRTTSSQDQMEELLGTFFPPLPEQIEEEGQRPQRAAVPMPNLTMEEVERQLMAAKSWKAPGEDGLPVAVWQQIWPVVNHHVLALFQASLEEGVLPRQWRHAKIIPLKKAGKEDYSVAGSWRPISLLCTLGKVLESVVAERISHAVETFGLLPANHFGGRKQRSAEQALLLLQEYVYNAWRGGRVLSLVSFDVKGAYNGVFKDRLLQRMRARGLPEQLVRWIGAFCSDRTASLQVNGQDSGEQALPQAGLPQGSPLSPVAYLFFNADLVQRRIDANGGAIAFIDDFTAWVTGPTAQSNLAGIQSIVDHATEWERRSGATFEAKKTAIIHFTRNARKLDTTPIMIKGQPVQPKEHAKILGVIMDARLKFRQHIAEAASKGLDAVMELKRLRGLSTRTARQLFAATVTPIVDYASNVWMHAYKYRLTSSIDRVQRAGAQAIVGTFMTVATAVAEAEAHIVSARERLWRRAIKMWIDVHTLPGTNPLSRMTKRIKKYYSTFRSPLHQVAEKLKDLPLLRMETVHQFSLEPWKDRLPLAHNDPSEELCAGWTQAVAVSSSSRNGVVGVGGVIQTKDARGNAAKWAAFSFTLGARTEQSPFSGELAAMAFALRNLPDSHRENIALFTRSKGAAAALKGPYQQSGQEFIKCIYDSVDGLASRANTVAVGWDSPDKNRMLRVAKRQAKAATQDGAVPQAEFPIMRSTILNIERRKLRGERSLPEGVGKFTKKVDAALPGNHTREIYDEWSWKERSVLAQLRTDVARLNGYLHRIKVVSTDVCACGSGRETVKHFLIHCPLWSEERKALQTDTNIRWDDLSFRLGGKSSLDGPNWKPNVGAVRATIQFALATGRLENEQWK